MGNLMSANLLMASIKSLEVNNADDDTLGNIEKSLNLILDNDTFDGLIQQEAFCKLTEIQEAMGKRAAKVLERDKKVLEEAAAIAKARLEPEDENGFTVTDNSENDQLIRLMIRAEKSGDLTFEFRGIKWTWNHALSSWDFTPKK